ncbi:MAG: isoprenylcysteine carboxylmethyltransferase family protein [Candidatus Manganitrophaceae bacterium]
MGEVSEDQVEQKIIQSVSRVIGYNRIPLSIVLGVGLFLFSAPEWRSLVLGIPFILLGEGVRIWSSGYLQKNKVLQIRGPYSLTRNPLYVGNFLIGLGFAIVGNSLLGGMLFMGGWGSIYTATVLEEERYLTRCFGEEYQVYLREVPRFFPRFSRPLSGGFYWTQVLAHRELNTWWGLAGGIALFSIRAWWLGTL